MNKLEYRELVPELRFPEFIASQEWRLTTFGEEAIFINGKAYKQDELLDKGKYRVLRVGNFFTNKEWYYSDLELDKDKYCNDGDLLYAWSASFGPRIWSGEKVIYHYHIWKVVEKEGVDKNFLYAILDFETEKMKAQSANGLGLLHITKGAIENWKCTFPKQKEQKKIADCLSSMDDLITSNTKKLESLELHRKGLMQKLFPEEGKSAPELRFSGFNEGWKETKVENVCYLQAGKFVKAVNIKSKENDRLYPCYGGNGLRGFTESFTHDGSYSLIGRQGALCGNVNFVTGRFHATEHAVVVEPKENVDNLWLYYELCRLNLNRFATGQAQPGLSVENLNRVDTFIPTLKKEQKKISESLFTIDELIKKQSKKVEVLKEYKKGLTQRLFPSNEGATV